jgi:hypothetical protein
MVMIEAPKVFGDATFIRLNVTTQSAFLVKKDGKQG